MEERADDDRVELAEALLGSVSDGKVDVEFLNEIGRRVDAVLAGSVELIDVHNSHAEKHPARPLRRRGVLIEVS
jgi:hypothetical protein